MQITLVAGVSNIHFLQNDWKSSYLDHESMSADSNRNMIYLIKRKCMILSLLVKISKIRRKSIELASLIVSIWMYACPSIYKADSWANGALCIFFFQETSWWFIITVNLNNIETLII